MGALGPARPLPQLVLLVTMVARVWACCPNNCNHENLAEPNGHCDGPTCRCICKEGKFGPDCSLYTCPVAKAWVDQAIATDNAHNDAECANMGECDRTTGLCICVDGFSGLACQRSK